MKNNKAIDIKGRLYDSVTGMPVKKPQIKKSDVVTNTKTSLVSKTHISRPQAPQKTALRSHLLIRKPGRNMDIAQSKSVSRFGQNNILKKSKQALSKTPIITNPITHPLIAKVEMIRSAQKNQSEQLVTAKSPKKIKEEAIAEALKKADEIKNQKQPNFFKRHKKLFNISTISLILLIVVGYITYLNMPGISVMVASTQAGIDAKYPEYHPNGFSLQGPVAYQDGEVTIKFRANAGGKEFTIKQSKSSWDSSAVKNMVDKESKGEFITTEERGLTIFTYNGNAAWVNGGILYTITGDAPLSSDQVRRIATSL